MDILLRHLDTIIVIVITLVIGIILFKKDKKTLYKLLIILVTEAEKQIKGEGKGARKFQMVIDKAYAWLPALIKVFLTKEALSDLIEKALKEAKHYWTTYPDILEDDADILEKLP